jgi:ubiquinone/menaquinone biosynthesis C-methylase UbiE
MLPSHPTPAQAIEQTSKLTMGKKAMMASSAAARTGTFYDRISDLYSLTFKVNGYGRSLEKYFREQPLPLPTGARILDAGCGPGLLTVTLLKAIAFPVRITALDLSLASVQKAREAVTKANKKKQTVSFTQGNLLHLPFADETFDFVVTSGALEYVPLEAGFAELSRVLKRGGHLAYLPVRPSPASLVLEKLFRFKAHQPEVLTAHTERHFNIVKDHKFPPHHPIGWTKKVVLAQKR